MEYVRSIILLAVVLALPLICSDAVVAASETVTQELRVTAKVPHHRDIIVDKNGIIVEISSNTKEDVRPTVYLERMEPKNKKPLTDKLYRQYRKYVPEGTAAYGVLYQRGLPVSLLNKASVSTNTVGMVFGRTRVDS